MALRTVGVKLMADVSGYVSGLQRAKASTTDFKGELDKAAKKGNLDAVADRAAVAGVALVGMAGYAIKSAADFEKSMSGIAAATHASAGEIGQLRAAALQAGKDTSFSATEAADGITELSKAGVSTANILGGGLKGALDLAAAGQLSVGEAAETAASALTQFKLQGSQVPHIADLLAAAAGKAQGSVHDMGYALNQSGLVAAQFGLTIEDTTGTLAEFASAGLTGSDAGTSFKTMLLAMANPSKQTQQLMNDLKITFYDAQGQFIGVSGVAQVLQDRLKNLTVEQRNAALGQIFGNDAIRAASILYTDGAEGVEKWKGAVNDAGYASATAQIQTNNLAGDIERLKGSLETVAIQSGGGAAGGLRLLAKGANEAVDAFGSLPGPVQSTLTVISGISGGGLLAAAAFIKMKKTSGDFMDQLRDMGPMGERTASGLSRIGSVATKFTLVGTAVGLAWSGLNMLSDWGEKRSAPVKADIDKLTESLKEFAATGRATGELASKYGDSLSKIGQDVQAVTKGMVDLKQAQADVKAGLSDPSVYQNWNPVDPQVTQRVKDLDEALTRLVQNGGASQANIFLRELQGTGKLTAEQFQQLNGLLPNYTTAAASATTANSGLAKGFGTTAANTATLAGKLEDAVGSGQKLTDTWAQLNGALLSSDKELLGAQQAVDAVTRSFKDNGRAVDGNSESALKNRIAVGEATKAAVSAAQAKLEETGSVTKASDVYNGYLGQLRKTLTQSGLTKKQVDDLIGSYGKMPDSVNTKVSITGDKAVNNALDQLLVKQIALQKGMSTDAASASLQKDLDRNKQRTYHAGGWTGPGAKYDTAGVVHADEFVLNKDARSPLEQTRPGALDYMNRTGKWPEQQGDRLGYADGGRVWPFPVTASHTKVPTLAEVLAAGGGSFGQWPGSPGAQRGDSGVWHRILSLVQASGIPYEFGNSYRAGDPLWHGSGRAIDFMGYNQDRLAQFFMSRMGSVLELIHRSDSADYGITRGHRAPMPHQWPLHKNHLHVAMKNGGTITEPITGVGASGRTYSFGENGQPERVIPNWQAGNGSGGGGMNVTINLTAQLAAGANIREAGRQIAEQLGAHLGAGGTIPVRTRAVTL